MLRYLSLIFLLALHPVQRAVFMGQNFTPPSGGGAVYVNSAIGANTGLDTPSVVTYSCAATGHLLWDFVYSDAVGITGYSVSSMTINLASQNKSLFAFAGTCPDTSSHSYTFTYTCTTCGGHAFSYLVETTGTLDAAGPGSGSTPTSTSLDASATATTSSGLCIAFGISNSWTPTPPAGYTLVYDDGESNFFYKNSCYTSTGVVSFSAPLISAPSAEYPTSIVLVH